MKFWKLTWVGVAVLVAAAATLLLSTGAGAGSNNHKFRWDIVSINFTTSPPTVSAGGTASAQAQDLSKITLTGTGTFRSNPGNPQGVTGGGAWTTYAPDGTTMTGHGTYDVTGFVSFTLAPGTFPPFTDAIGISTDGHAGLAVLQIAYSDGSEGVLVVSCHFVGTPDSVFEGVTASKGFVDYWNHVGPVGNTGRTAFHIVR